MKTTENEILALIRQYAHSMLQKGVLVDHLKIFDFLQREYFLNFQESQHPVANKIINWHRAVIEGHFLQDLLNSYPQAEEIVLHHFQLASIVESIGHQQIPLQIDWLAEDYQLALEVFCFRYQQAWNYLSPFVSFSVGAIRYGLIHYSALGQQQCSKIFMRQQRNSIPELTSFAPTELAIFLQRAIEKKSNLIVAGATGSGKTTLLQSMLNTINNDEHCIVIEDTEEIRHQHPLTTSLLAQNRPGHTMNDFCHYAMRMRPDRIVVGEMRSKEVIPFLLALNTGHKGMMSTVHANSCQEVFKRLGTLFSLYQESSTPIDYKTVVELIARNIDYIIFVEQKKITQVLQILACEGDLPLYEEIYSATNPL